MSYKALLFIALCVIVSASHHGDKEHHHHQPKPYHFGYDIKDHHGSHYRKEQGDGHGHVQGSYGYTDHKGIHREVHYVADHHGFRATVKTNEPGTANQDPAHVKLHSNAHHAADHDHGHHHHHVPQHHGHHHLQHAQEHHNNYHHGHHHSYHQQSHYRYGHH